MSPTLRLIAAHFLPGSDALLPHDGICCVEVEVADKVADLVGVLDIGQMDDPWGQRLREACIWDPDRRDWVGWLQDRAEQIASAGPFRIVGLIYGARRNHQLSLCGDTSTVLLDKEDPTSTVDEYRRCYSDPVNWDGYDDDD